jgi:hypothetical protein
VPRTPAAAPSLCLRHDVRRIASYSLERGNRHHPNFHAANGGVGIERRHEKIDRRLVRRRMSFTLDGANQRIDGGNAYAVVAASNRLGNARTAANVTSPVWPRRVMLFTASIATARIGTWLACRGSASAPSARTFTRGSSVLLAMSAMAYTAGIRM